MKLAFREDNVHLRGGRAVFAVVIGVITLVGCATMSPQSSRIEDDRPAQIDISDKLSGVFSLAPHECEIDQSAIYPWNYPASSHDETSSELQFGSRFGPFQVLSQRLDEAFRSHDSATVRLLLGERRVLDLHLPQQGGEWYSSIETWMGKSHAIGESIAVSEAGRAEDIVILGTRRVDSGEPQPISIAVDMTGDCSMTVHTYHHQDEESANQLAVWVDAGLLMFSRQAQATGSVGDITRVEPFGTAAPIALEKQGTLESRVVEIGKIPWTIGYGESDGPEFRALWTGKRFMAVASVASSIAVLSYDAAEDRWERSPALPGPQRAVGGIVWTGNQLLLVGGGQFEPSQEAWSYEPDARRWKRIEDLPYGPVENLHGTMGDGVAYFAGAERETVPSQAEIVAYNLALQKWKVISLPVSSENFPYRGRSHADLSHANLQSSSPLTGRDEFRQLLWTGTELVYFYVVLGEHAASTFAEPCRDHAAAFAIPEPENREDAPPSVLLFYDPEQDSWRASSPMPPDHSIPQSLAWTGSHVVLWGGMSSAAHLGCEGHVSVGHGYLYDVTADRWQPMSPSPLGPRCGHSTTWTGSRIIFFGGTPSCNGNSLALSDGAIYDPGTDSWVSFRLESRTQGDS